MHVMIETSSPDAVPAGEVAAALERAGWFVQSVTVNDGDSNGSLWEFGQE